MKKKLILLLTLLIIFSNIFLVHNAYAYSIGISPAKFHFEKLLPDNVVLKKITISHSSEDELSKYNLEVKGTGAKYISLSTTSVYFDSNNTKREITYIINPKDAIPGQYQAEVHAAKDSSTLNSNAPMTLLLGVKATIDFSVVDKPISNLEILSTQVYQENNPDTKKQISIYIGARNQGNITEEINSLSIMYQDNNDESKVYYETLPLTNFVIEPFTTLNYSTKSSLKIKPGKYKVTVGVIQKNKRIDTKTVEVLNVTKNRNILVKFFSNIYKTCKKNIINFKNKIL